MQLSAFGEKLSKRSGISELMIDLGEALSGDRPMLMLGGGNPAHIPAVQERFRQAMRELLDAPGGAFERAIGNYDTPQGNRAFIEALAALLHSEFGWDISPANIALTNGSQTAFFMLFNMFAGLGADGRRRKILLPLAPEYIGYSDVGLTDDFFVANRPIIENIDERTFKYHVDFDALKITDEIGAICVSRPTNPTGNVLTDDEIEKLGGLARDNDIPLIIDNAYGTPFPNIIFTKARPVWNANTVVCMSLSKLGLPAARTGIVIAREEIIAAVAEMNAIQSLSPTGLGASLVTELVRSGEIISMSRDVIRPYYKSRVEWTLEIVHSEFGDLEYRVHSAEGALFVWFWFPGLPITSRELYERLKHRGVLVISGHYFFPGLDEPWRHKDECIRVTYSQAEETVAAGLKIIAEEVRRAYSERRKEDD